MSTARGGAEGEVERQVLRNATHLLLAYVIPRLFTVVSVVVAARALGAERFGGYGAAAACAVILGVLASLGMLPLLVREIARAPQRAGQLLATAHRIKAVTGGAMLLLAWPITGVWFAGQPGPRLAAMVLCIGWAIHAFAENVAAYYQAIERMARWTQACAAFGIVSSVVGVTLLLWTDSIVVYCWGFVAGWACGLAWLVIGLPRDMRGISHGQSAPAGELLHGLAPFAAAFIGLTIYCKVDVMLLARWSDAAQAGLYTAAYKFVDVFQALVIVAAGAVYPRLSRAAASSPKSDGGRRSAELLLVCALPAGLGLHLLSTPVVRIVFGDAYGGAVGVLARLALLLPLLSLTILGGYILGAVGRMSAVALLYGVGLAVNLGLNVWLIPALGAEGAAVARLASESVLVVGFMEVLRRHAAASPGPRALAVAGAGALTAAVAALLPDPTGGWLRTGAFLLILLVIYHRAGVWHASGLSTFARELTRRREATPPAPVEVA